MKKSVFYLFLQFWSLCLFGIEEYIFLAEVPVGPVASPMNTLSLEDICLTERSYYLSKNKLPNDISLSTEYKIAFTKKEHRGRFTPYEKEKVSGKECIYEQEDLLLIQNLYTLFRNESFGMQTASSQETFDQKMRLVFLLNRMKSIFSVLNQSLKTPKKVGDSSLVLKGAWEPQWQSRSKGNHWKNVSLKEVRAYMRGCIQKVNTADLSIEERGQWKKKIEELAAKEKNLSGHVPYHELREYLRTSQKRNRFVKEFVNTHPGARLYEATHDSDIVGLRCHVDGYFDKPAIGLYSYYLDVLARERSPLDILSTGYRAAWGNPPVE